MPGNDGAAVNRTLSPKRYGSICATFFSDRLLRRYSGVRIQHSEIRSQKKGRDRGCLAGIAGCLGLQAEYRFAFTALLSIEF